MQVCLIRHPRPCIAAGMCYGRLDIDAEEVADTCARLRPRLPVGVPVICSPLRRARALAEAIDPKAVTDARLVELDFGNWEGRPWEGIAREELDAWAADVLHFTPPGGESVARLAQRAISFATSLSVPQVIIVTHAGVMRALVGHWRGLPAAVWTTLQFDYGSLTELDISP